MDEFQKSMLLLKKKRIQGIISDFIPVNYHRMETIMRIFTIKLV